MSKRMKRVVYIVCGLAIIVSLCDPVGRYLEALDCGCDTFPGAVTFNGLATFNNQATFTKPVTIDSTTGDLQLTTRKIGYGYNLRSGFWMVSTDPMLRVGQYSEGRTNALEAGYYQSTPPYLISIFRVDTSNSRRVVLENGAKLVAESTNDLKLSTSQGDVVITLGNLDN